MYALQRLLFLASLLLFPVFSVVVNIPHTACDIQGIAWKSGIAYPQIDEPTTSTYQEQTYCLLESAEEAEERTEEHLRHRPFGAILVIAPILYAPLLVNITSKAVGKTGNNARRFLIFCNWRL